VDSDGGDLNLSSEDEAGTKAKGKTEPGPPAVEAIESVNRASTLATTKVCSVPRPCSSSKVAHFDYRFLHPPTSPC
jgi:hypothetical protein